ncbi:MAG TPA: hypothetical protein DCM32_00255 [Xanthomonadaceae bacterium]|nr:hypothetical protein [Xanthomonadaceae bacterium]
MTETFDYLFGGSRKAKARRWINPDGTQGGIVAADATLDAALRIPTDAVVWSRASIGDGASIGQGDWFHFAGPFGEHRRLVTAVHSKANGLRWWGGGQNGITTERFIERLTESHRRGEEADDVCREYAHLIGFVTTHPEVVKREAAR